MAGAPVGLAQIDLTPPRFPAFPLDIHGSEPEDGIIL